MRQGHLHALPVPDHEVRSAVEAIVLQAAAADDEPPVLEGYAARFNSETQIGGDPWGWRERIAPGAFAETIKRDDIRALFNHNPNIVLGRRENDTLTLAEDTKGLRVTITTPDTSVARDVVALVKRGDVDGMSVAFRVKAEEWEEPKRKGELPTRTLKELQLFDIGPVVFPAYPTTSVKARDQAKTYGEVEARAEQAAADRRTADAQARERAFLLADAEAGSLTGS